MSTALTIRPSLRAVRPPMVHKRLTMTDHDRPEPRMDEPTLTELIREYSVPLLGYVTKLTFNDRQLAEDIVQETFVRAWQRPHVLNSRHSTVGPWLFTVARNLVNDHRRSRATRPTEVSDGELATFPEERDWISETLLAQDMRRAMARLTPRQRAVLSYVYHRDLSFEDVARRLGIPVGTVKSRTHYALRSLRSILRELGIGR
jgi:RNA polymerase sigma-70 factor, ECF subfamily